MWIASSQGWLSIVAHRDRPDCLLVRARRKEHIAASFPGAHIRETPQADYRWRAELPRAQVADVIGQQIASIQYGNFKNSVHERKLLAAYHRIWEIMAELQDSDGRPDCSARSRSG